MSIQQLSMQRCVMGVRCDERGVAVLFVIELRVQAEEKRDIWAWVFKVPTENK